MPLRSAGYVTIHASLSVLIGLLALTPAILPAPSALAGCEVEVEPAGGFPGYPPNSISVAGNRAVIGAQDYRVDGIRAGAAFVFEYNGSEWIETARLVASDAQADDRFGSSVDQSGDVIVVGARSRPPEGESIYGAVYVFRKTGAVWMEEAILRVPGPSDEYGLGERVAVSGDVIATATGDWSGAVHVFRHDGASWLHTHEFRGTYGQNDFFGSGIALDTDRLLIGASRDDLQVPGGGAAYLLTYDGADWNEEAVFAPEELIQSAYFGTSVAFQDGYVAIGATGWASFDRVYVYRETETDWDLHATLTPPGQTGQIYFGHKVAIDNNLLAVSAYGARVPQSANGGIIYLYDMGAGGGDTLTQLGLDRWGDKLGLYLEMSDGWVVTNRDYRGGAALFFPVGDLGVDCNGNGINDVCDVDCDHDGAADACEGIVDCDANGLLDTCDIDYGWVEDCDGNQIPDGCEEADWENLDCNFDGIPDVCNIADGTVPDCNANDVPDACDTRDGGSADCNVNAIPDECEIDCNANTIPDDCDIADGTSDDCNFDAIPDDCQPEEDCNGNGVSDICDIGSGAEGDCNRNFRPDSCEIADGTSADGNANGVPDDCERPMPDATFQRDGTVRTCTTDADCTLWLNPVSEVYCVLPPAVASGTGTCYIQRNRYISIDPNTDLAGSQTARRVSLLLDGGATAVLGWVGEPAPLTVTGPEPSLQLLSRIEAEPHYRDWSVDNDGVPWLDETVHVGDCEISPGYTYHVQSIPVGADVFDEAAFSEPLVLRTVTHWGDVTSFHGDNPPDTSRSFKDINAVVRGFLSLQDVTKVSLDLAGGASTPEIPDFTDISFTDINATVLGFTGGSYPYAAPLDCPDQMIPWE